MSDTHHDFDLAAESPGKNNGPKTEELDSGDYFNAPERHWLVRFSVVIFGIGLLAGASATTAASNNWIAFLHIRHVHNAFCRVCYYIFWCVVVDHSA